MNITETWPNETEKFPLNTDTIFDFLIRRRNTFRGFASIEKYRGVIKPEVSLNTSEAQEMMRVLMFRVIEEVAESMAAKDPNHIKEEAIDAINYLWSLLIIDTPRYPLVNVAPQLAFSLNPENLMYRQFNTFTPQIMGEIAVELSNVGEFMRNRAWMNNAQDIYFSGTDALAVAIYRVTGLLSMVFDSWDEFARFYIAKDRVLQFRLRSNY